MWIVCRDAGAGVEIAEHSDGAMKAYASKKLAEASRELLGEGWDLSTIWLLDKGSDITRQAAALAETGMFSEQAIRSIDTLVKTMERRR
jgi:hypothetical protein